MGQLLQYSPRKPLPPQTTSFFFAAEAIVVSSAREKKLETRSSKWRVVRSLRRSYPPKVGPGSHATCQDSRGEPQILEAAFEMLNDFTPNLGSPFHTAPDLHLNLCCCVSLFLPWTRCEYIASDTSRQSGGALSQRCPPPQQTSASKSVKARITYHDRELTTRRTSA